jgi:tRNA pseudouridine55 synthase
MIDPKELAESGVLLVDKPAGWTSHDVVNCVRRRFGVRKVGHCGTLDPAATGLLVVVLGQATRLSERLSGQDKHYAGTMRLGEETFSQDRDSEVTARKDTSHLTPEDVRRVAAAFVGTLQQVPPMVSAVKVNGRPLYKLARKGQVVEREARTVTVHSLTLTRLAIPEVDFELSCSKGTYVRTICADIGTRLGCGAHLYALRRLRSGRFDVKDAQPMDAIKEQWTREDLFRHVVPLARIFPFL